MQQTLLLALIATAATSTHQPEVKPGLGKLPSNVRMLPTRKDHHGAETLRAELDSDAALAQ